VQPSPREERLAAHERDLGGRRHGHLRRQQALRRCRWRAAPHQGAEVGAAEGQDRARTKDDAAESGDDPVKRGPSASRGSETGIRDGAARLGLQGAGGVFEPIDARQDRERLIGGCPMLDGQGHERTRLARIAAIERQQAAVQQLVAVPLTLGNRAAGAFDVGARAGVAAVDKEHPRPDVDRLFVLIGEVVGQPGEQQRFDARVAVTIRDVSPSGLTVGSKRVCHLDERVASAGRIIVLPMAIIESIPNVSEGRRPEVVEALAAAVRSVPGVRLLAHSSDASHNRSVFTLAGDAPSLKAAILALFDTALAHIDLRTHRGEHPRLGAVDVVPFVPIEGATMDDCIALSRDVGAAVAERFGLPVYLYEEASKDPARRNLEDIRRGEFEGLAARMSQPAWTPDFGPSQPHERAGATVIGARMPLIAYNINLNTNRVDVAKKIAAAIRHSSGGLRFVKAMGLLLEDRQIAQVSMNLTNYQKTPIFRAFEMVRREAERYGVTILESEIVGLVPSAALTATAEYYLQLEGFSPAQVLENKLR
jgi:glutamate formiminotransferase